jgi:NitT/TauT family transport system substrate-binding protein
MPASATTPRTRARDGLHAWWRLAALAALAGLLVVACGPASQPAPTSPPAPTARPTQAAKPTATQPTPGIQAPAAKAPPEVTTVEIWAVRDPQEAAQIALADELGYYKDEGLDVTIKWVVSGTDVPSLAASGQINFYGEGTFTCAILKDKGLDMRHVMRTADISGTQAFVLGPNTNISSPLELEGKKVGMAAGAGVSVAIASMAKQYGVDYDKIIFVNLQPPDQAPALARGDIDAMAVWEPWALAGRKLGGRLYFTGNRSYIEGEAKPVNWLYLDSGLNVKGDFLEKNPNTVKAMMRALIRATDYINSNLPEQVAEVLSKPMQIEKADLVEMIKENIYSNDMDQHAIEGMTDFMKWGAGLKYTSREMTPKDVLDLRLLKELAPEKVKVAGY